MILRAVTLGLDLSWPTDFERLGWAGEALAELAAAFQDRGHEVQTTRLALRPYYELMPPNAPSALVEAAGEIERAVTSAGIGYVSLGPVRWSHLGPEVAEDFVASVVEAIIATNTVFCSIEVADSAGIRFAAVRSAGRAMAEIGCRTEGGFGNLRLAAIANCPPQIPFFPAGYHQGETPMCSIAVQSADLVADALGGGGDLVGALSRVSAAVSEAEQELRAIATRAGRDRGIGFAGVDRSPAPFPTDAASAARMLESVGVERLGEPGSVAAAMLLTRALRGHGRRTETRDPVGLFGFSGLMLPLLEDRGLARRAEEGLISWTELLLYSAVCGTGLDTIPLPGDTSEEQLASIVLDVAALSTALRKPLTCRLMPVPGLRPEDRTTFDFPYFANTVVLDPRGPGAGRLLRRADGDVGP